MASYAKFASSLGLSQTLPITDSNLELFIAELFDGGRPSSSIASITSAISFFHKCNNLVDPTKSPGIQTLLAGIKKLRPTSDSRRPITENLLFKMISEVQRLTFPHLQQCLFQAMFLMAFYFGLRIGEITDSIHNLQRANVTIEGSKLFIHFSSFKHSPTEPSPHFFKAAPNKPFCLVEHMKAYLSIRGDSKGPLFLLLGKPVARAFFFQTMRQVLDRLGISTKDYNTHSFRIGAASHWANEGLSLIQIKSLGRWRSDAAFKYVRGSIDHSI